MILIVEFNSYGSHSNCCVCDTPETAFDYIRTITDAPLVAFNFKYGVEQKVRYEGYANFKEVKESPYQWRYVYKGNSYYLQPIEYFSSKPNKGLDKTSPA